MGYRVLWKDGGIMIASLYRLTRADIKALKITDAYSLHRAVYSLFPKTEEAGRDFLYADKGGDLWERKVLLISCRIPEKPVHGTVESKLIPEAFLSHDHYGFEIVVNPVKRDNATKKLVPIRDKEDLISWFLSKAPSFGFLVDPQSLQIQHVGVQRFQKDAGAVTHGSATFLGRLQVTDRAAFRKSFRQGIGRAKGFGFGLLQIIPLQK